MRKARGAAFPGVAWFEMFIPGNPGLVGEQVGRMGRSGVKPIRLSLRSWGKWGMVTQSLLGLVVGSGGTGSEAPEICRAS